MAQENQLSFLELRLPKNNEYTTEPMEALLANLARNQKRSLFSLFSSQKPLLALIIFLKEQTIYFSIGVPTEKLNFFQSQILSYYPDVLINLTQNPFLEVASSSKPFPFVKMALTEGNYYPLKTAADFTDVDPLASILSTLAKVKDPQARAYFQIILTPAPRSFTKNLNEKIVKGVKNPDGSYSPHPDQALLQKKAEKLPLAAAINLAASHDEVLEELAGSFGIFSHPKGNSLVPKKPNFLNRKKLWQKIVACQPSRSASVLNLAEIAALWHLPSGKINLPNILWGRTLITQAPADLPVAENLDKEEKKTVCFFAKTEFKNKVVNFGLKKADRRLHFYTIGKTGTGKSTLIANMAISDIRNGEGVAVIDPHGDLINILLDYIPASRLNDVCYFNPADREYTYPLNPLEVQNKEQKELVASGIVAIFQKLYGYSWGPRLEHILRNSLLSLVEIPETTLVDVVRILTEPGFRQKVVSRLESPTLRSFWENEFGKMPDRLREEAISPILNKVGQFVSSPLIRKIIQTPQSKINLEKIMNEGQILLADLSQGKLGEDNSSLLGAMLITQVQLAAMGRVYQAEESRRDFYLYVDEFQNFATTSFIKILSEARKYRLNLTFANQYMAQLEPSLQSAIFGNVGSLVSFVVGNEDAHVLAREFAPDYDENDLISLDRFQVLTKLSINGRTSRPFLAYTLPLPDCRNQHREKVIRNSQERFGKKIK